MSVDKAQEPETDFLATIRETEEKRRQERAEKGETRTSARQYFDQAQGRYVEIEKPGAELRHHNGHLAVVRALDIARRHVRRGELPKHTKPSIPKKGFGRVRRRSTVAALRRSPAVHTPAEQREWQRKRNVSRRLARVAWCREARCRRAQP